MRGNRQTDPKVYIIAGPNGSGKTTFARKFLPIYAKCNNFINADLIASGLSPFSPRVAAMKAGKLVLEQIGEFSKKRADFAFETTLAGKSYARHLKAMKRGGYKLHLFFLWIPTAKLALGRIKERVAEGGHDVPAADVRRRFHRGIKNFFLYYCALADSWMFFDNSGITPRLIAEHTGKIVRVIEQKIFNEIKNEYGVIL